ncbi:MAG: ABC transporter permease [Acidimicrobiia bacterium]|nr:ABC transporter permease [Acidimicrobiia bacterium]
MSSSATMKLAQSETRLFLRDPIALFFGLVFPSVLLLALGYFFPGFGDEPAADLGGLRYIDTYTPIAIGLGLATLGLVTLPPILGTYRQFGILRRLRTTPVHPARLLWALMALHIVVAVLALIAAMTVSIVAFDVVFPENFVAFVLVFLLSAASIFSVGLLVGAIARTTSSGAAIGMSIYFPFLFLGGVWIPRQVMPDGLRFVSDLTPLGAAVGAMDDAWFSGTVDVAHLLVMAVYVVVVGLLAIRVFRWE